jgi:hypothetical protein
MRHRLITNIEKAFGWPDASGLGRFAHGRLADQDLPFRLMTPHRLLDLLARRALGLPKVRCVRDGADLHENRYTTTLESRRAAHIHTVDPARLSRLLAGGVTVVADAVNVVDPTVEIACRAMRWWTGEMVGVNAYLTTGATTGFNLHWDDHDVIVVQVAGTKGWEVRVASRVAPLYRDAEHNHEAPTDVVWRGELAAGEVLHIPRGHWHQATRAEHDPDGFSLHLTFGLQRRTGVNWLEFVADQSRERELLRTDLPGTDDLDAHSTALGRAAHELIERWSPADLLTHRRRTQPPARHVSTAGVFGPADAVIAITEFEPDLGVTDSAVMVRAAGKELTCRPAALPALRALLSGHPVELDKLAVQTGIDVAPLAARLLEEGLCAEMTEALWWGCTGLVPTVT